MTDRDGRVRTAILRRVLRGAGVRRDAADAALAAETGLGAGEVAAALAALQESGAVYLHNGALVAAYPFSLVPTPHRVVISETTVYANCAIDALAIPPMVEAEASITSACGECGAPIHLLMRASTVRQAEPAATVVFYVDRECCAAGPAVLTRCPHIQFFCDAGHAARWRRAHPELHGVEYDPADAAAFAARHFAATIAAVRETR